MCPLDFLIACFLYAELMGTWLLIASLNKACDAYEDERGFTVLAAPSRPRFPQRAVGRDRSATDNLLLEPRASALSNVHSMSSHHRSADILCVTKRTQVTDHH